MRELSIAIPKGRLFEPTVELLAKVGICPPDLSEDSRKLIFEDKDHAVKLLLMRSSDVPVYVEYGAADLGIVGKDVILEAGRDVCELVDLNYGLCRFVVAAPRDIAGDDILERTPFLRVATKFPRIAEAFFASKGIRAEIIKLHGSVELAPQAGLAEFILDITSSGRTLAENNLAIVSEVLSCTARLIANRVSFRLNWERIDPLLSEIKRHLGGAREPNAIWGAQGKQDGPVRDDAAQMVS